MYVYHCTLFMLTPLTSFPPSLLFKVSLIHIATKSHRWITLTLNLKGHPHSNLSGHVEMAYLDPE